MHYFSIKLPLDVGIHLRGVVNIEKRWRRRPDLICLKSTTTTTATAAAAATTTTTTTTTKDMFASELITYIQLCAVVHTMFAT
jgi:hypothetical protein